MELGMTKCSHSEREGHSFVAPWIQSSEAQWTGPGPAFGLRTLPRLALA